jgi:hypothetical protein
MMLKMLKNRTSRRASICPWTSPQQRPCLIQRRPLAPHTPTRARAGTWTCDPGRLNGRRRTTNIRRACNTNAGHPPTHPPARSTPAHVQPLLDAMVVDNENDFVVAGLGPSALLCIAIVPELQADGGIHDEDASGAEEEGSCPKHPVRSFATHSSNPTCTLTWCVGVPRTRIGEERGRVEQVPEKGCGEKSRT